MDLTEQRAQRGVCMSSEHAGWSPKIKIIDQVAGAALSLPSQVRYEAYRDALIACEQDSEQVVRTLWLFLWNLSAGCSVNGVH